MSILVSATVLVQTGTRSTRVRVFITVQGTISVTHSKAGAGGARMQGVCLQAWQARASCPASKTARTMAANHGRLGVDVMAIYLQVEGSLLLSGRDSTRPRRSGAHEAYTRKTRG